MPGRYDVYVFRDGETYYVRPAVAMVLQSAGQVKVRNLTDHAVEINLPAPIGLYNPHVTIPPHETANIGFPATADGIYDYCVDVLVGPNPQVGTGSHVGPGSGTINKTPAVGNSFPKIIVDP
jgi:hypothetical protein